MITLDTFIGSENTINTVRSMILQNTLPHAIVIEGAEGSGRRTLARIIASAATCVSNMQALRPCGVCPQCVKALANTLLDITEIDGTSSKSYAIDVIRQIRADAMVAPAESNARVFILANAGIMSSQSQNALLKIFEEPPKFVKFILTVQSKTELIETIRSRAMFLSLSVPTPEKAISALMSAKFLSAVDNDTAKKLQKCTSLAELVNTHGGNISAIHSAVTGTKSSSSEATNIAAAIASSLIEKTDLPLLRALVKLEKSRDLSVDVCERLRLICFEALRIKSGGKPQNTVTHNVSESLADSKSTAKLLDIIASIEDTSDKLEANANVTLSLTSLAARLR